VDGPHVELRAGSDGVLEAWRDEERVAVFVEQPGGRCVVAARAAPVEPRVLGAVLDALLTRHGRALELDTTDPLVRDFARHRGFTGALRGPLVPGGAGVPPTDDVVGVEAALHQLLPDIRVRVEATPGPVRSWLRRTVSGVANLINVDAAPDDREESTRFSVPLRADLLVESIARCIDTAIAIRRRFPAAGRTVRRISFDHADFELLHGNHAGSADRNSGTIHMNASFATFDGLAVMETARAARAAGGWPPPVRPTGAEPDVRVLIPVRNPAQVPPPWNVIDAVTAHEMWHQMEGAVEGRRSLDGLELRRSLGEALGVETLEQAINGGRPRAPDAWKAAHARLVDEVSSYGASAPLEATAEMFMLWWCADGGRAPVVERFGQLAVPLLDAFGR
jgi:hypothetical protein